MAAGVIIVEEEQNTWRRVKRGTKLQLDALRMSALLLSSQRVKLHSVVESLITSAVKNALSRTPQQALLATRHRASSKWRGSSVVLRCVCPGNLRHVIHMFVRVMLVFRWISKLTLSTSLDPGL